MRRAGAGASDVRDTSGRGPKPPTTGKRGALRRAHAKGKPKAPAAGGRTRIRGKGRPVAAKGGEKPGRREGISPSRGPAVRRARAARPVVPVAGEGVPAFVPGLDEEEQIRAAKYLPRELPKRLFEEERFLFPESYGVNRIRLLVRDPDWIFAYWDVNPAAMEDLGRRLGERALALSRLTLRIVDPVSGERSDILLPPGARWWYVRTDAARRSYRAELGVTLPSGEYRRLAESNTVVTPRVGPSSERARRRLSYADARRIPLSEAEAAARAELQAGVSKKPWARGSLDGGVEPGPAATPRAKGGASDSFRPAPSETRPGASDGFRR